MRPVALLLALTTLTSCGVGETATSEPLPPPPSAPNFAGAPVPPSATTASSLRPAMLTAPPMVSFPAGVFHQGSAGATGDDFGWQHDEAVPAFELDVTEVTVEAYQACLDSGTCTYGPRGDKCNLERPRDEYRRDPVNCVTYSEALKFCEWRRSTLPTDGMWEYAAGGKRGWSAPWGVTPARPAPPGLIPEKFTASNGTCRDLVPWNDGSLPGREKYGGETTCPAGTFPRGDSPEGLKDLLGNVSEWTSTIYCKVHNKECEDDKRTVKGLSYRDGGPGIHFRYAVPETEWRPTIGFRCARVKSAPPKAGKN